MDLGVAVHLGGRGEQEAGLLLLGQAEGVEGADGADLEGLDRQREVVDRARRAREVQDQVDVTDHVDVVGDVDPDEAEAVVPDEVGEVVDRPRGEVVEGDDLVTTGDQSLAQVGPEEPGPAGDDGTHPLLAPLSRCRG